MHGPHAITHLSEAETLESIQLHLPGLLNLFLKATENLDVCN